MFFRTKMAGKRNYKHQGPLSDRVCVGTCSFFVVDRVSQTSSFKWCAEAVACVFFDMIFTIMRGRASVAKKKSWREKTKVLLKEQKCKRNEQDIREWGTNRKQKYGYIFLNKSSSWSTRKVLERVRRSNSHAWRQSWVFFFRTQKELSVFLFTIRSEDNHARVSLLRSRSWNVVGLEFFWPAFNRYDVFLFTAVVNFWN